MGWIDGTRRRVDEHTYVIRFAPRRPLSTWSVPNIAKVQRLRAQGCMTPGEQASALRSDVRSAVYSLEQPVRVARLPQKLEEFNTPCLHGNFFKPAPGHQRKERRHANQPLDPAGGAVLGTRAACLTGIDQNTIILIAAPAMNTGSTVDFCLKNGCFWRVLGCVSAPKQLQPSKNHQNLTCKLNFDTPAHYPAADSCPNLIRLPSGSMTYSSSMPQAMCTTGCSVGRRGLSSGYTASMFFHAEVARGVLGDVGVCAVPEVQFGLTQYVSLKHQGARHVRLREVGDGFAEVRWGHGRSGCCAVELKTILRWRVRGRLNDLGPSILSNPSSLPSPPKAPAWP